MENNTNLLGQLNISNYSIHILSKYIHELILTMSFIKAGDAIGKGDGISK
jgi:hypothetical protein